MEPDERDQDRELIELADELLLQATEIHRQWGELAGVLGVERPGAPPAEVTGQGATERPDENTAMLVALDMLLAGQSQDEVTAHVRETFAGMDADTLVARVFAEYGG